MSLRPKVFALFLFLVAIVLLMASCSPSEPGGRVIVLGLDGMDPSVVDLLMSEGKLPNFARMRQEGAYGRLRSAKPLLSPVIWTTIATGKRPTAHGIGHFVATDPLTGEKAPVTSELRRVKAIWNIFTDLSKTVGVVGWWASWPAEQVNGTVVSDRTCYHFLFPQGERGSAESLGVTYPPERLDELAPLIRRPEDVTFDEASAFLHVNREEFDRPFDFEDDTSHFRWALATADSYRAIGLELWRKERPDLLLVYVEATDSVSHLFGHVFRAGQLHGELAEQQARYRDVVEQTYIFADRIVGDYIDAMNEDTTLLVLSDHGFRLGARHNDPTMTRDMRRVSEKYHRMDGILYMFGRGVKPHSRIPGPTLLDITPTVLALAGLPVAEDMPGSVVKDVLRVDAPVPAVASFETRGGGGNARVQARTARPTDEELMKRLESLGYLGDTGNADPPDNRDPAGAMTAGTTAARQSVQGEQNLAAIYFQEGRFAEAALEYGRLLEEHPNDPTLHTSFAGALGALGRYDEALEHLEIAIQDDPLNVEAYHNRGVIFERRNDQAKALEMYRTAVRYNPQYEPSRRALVRLTGSASVLVADNEEQRRAFDMAEEASRAARGGDYRGALDLLQEALALAPDSAVLYQYQANVFYLQGDHPAAVRALEEALALEPDNALYRVNLERLKGKAAGTR